MAKIPDISIIMSVFNGEDFLEKSIESVLNQTFAEFEFIIINDGSTDDSLEIIERFRIIDDRIKLINQENQGLAKSLNVGIKNSQGRYIARTDADDLCYESRLEKQFNFMEKNNSVDLIGSSVDVIDENGTITSEKIQISKFENICIKKFFLSPVLHVTFFGKRSFFQDHMYRENFIYAQDYDLVLRGIDSGSIIMNMEEKLMQYRDFQKKINPNKFIYQFRISQLAIKLSKERIKYGKEASNIDLEVKKIMSIQPFNIFIVKIFLKAYFLKSSKKNVILKKIFNLIFFFISKDLRQLLIRDFRAYKI